MLIKGNQLAVSGAHRGRRPVCPTHLQGLGPSLASVVRDKQAARAEPVIRFSGVHRRCLGKKISSVMGPERTRLLRNPGAVLVLKDLVPFLAAIRGSVHKSG